MVRYEITYMVDPGDGIESKDQVDVDHDNMIEALSDWWNTNECCYFITKCEIVAHPLMVG